MYGTLPSVVVPRTLSSTRARPKSHTWAASPTIKMFCGLMSQCWMAIGPCPKLCRALLR